MWPVIALLALFAASGSAACPKPCACQPLPPDARSGDDATAVTCDGGAPLWRDLPISTGRLTIDGASRSAVIGMLEYLKDTPTNLRELILRNCPLVTLNVPWSALEDVVALNVSRNNVTDLKDVLVPNGRLLPNLTTFDASDNLLSGVDAFAFKPLLQLERLILRRNRIASVNEHAFRGIFALRYLDLSGNELTALPDIAMQPLPSLEGLNLGGNRLRVHDATWFKRLGHGLRELDLSWKGSVARTPLSSGQLSVLRLAGNPTDEVDVKLLMRLRRWETVDASRTGLARVPPALTQSVRALRLAGNRLTRICDGDLDSYPLLRLLDVSDNQLREVEEDALGRLEVLEELDVSGNRLDQVPRSLPGSLTVLSLARNAIADIQEGAFAQLSSLVELDLSGNPVKLLTAGALSGPSNLATLRVSNLTLLKCNRQDCRGDMAFPVPTPERLVRLDVSRSPVLAAQLLADDAALSACKSLAELNLSGANLTSVRSDLGYLLPQLRRVGLAGNAWNCSEDLYWLGEWIRRHEETEPVARCAEPSSARGSHLRDMPVPVAVVGRRGDRENETVEDSDGGNATTAEAIVTREYSTTNATDSTPSTRSVGVANAFDALLQSKRNAVRPRSTSTSSPSVAELRDQPEDERSSTTISAIRSSAPTNGERRRNVELLDEDAFSERDQLDHGSNDPNETTPATAARAQSASDLEDTTREDNTASPDNTTALPTDLLAPNAIPSNDSGGERAANCGARVSEPLATGAHPGMLILAGAALGAAASLMVVLSRRATTRRRDRYQRQKNIEVHTLTLMAEMW